MSTEDYPLRLLPRRKTDQREILFLIKPFLRWKLGAKWKMFMSRSLVVMTFCRFKSGPGTLFSKLYAQKGLPRRPLGYFCCSTSSGHKEKSPVRHLVLIIHQCFKASEKCLPPWLRPLWLGPLEPHPSWLHPLWPHLPLRASQRFFPPEEQRR